MSQAKKTAGLPLHTQLFGGFQKADVIAYVEHLADTADADHAALQKEKEQIYEILKHCQDLCENLTQEAQQKAEIILQTARKESEAMLHNAHAETARLRCAREQLAKESQGTMDQLSGSLTTQRQQAEESYEQIQQQIDFFLSLLKGDQDVI